MNYQGVVIGFGAFIIIGLFHPVVIKTEYHFGKRVWPVFLVCGVLFLALSLFIPNAVFSSIVGVLGFSCLWSIREMMEQEERVKRGWFPQNPGRSKK